MITRDTAAFFGSMSTVVLLWLWPTVLRLFIRFESATLPLAAYYAVLVAVLTWLAVFRGLTFVKKNILTRPKGRPLTPTPKWLIVLAERVGTEVPPVLVYEGSPNAAMDRKGNLYVSTGLLELLDHHTREAAVAHELIHKKRQENGRTHIVWMTFFACFCVNVLQIMHLPVLLWMPSLVASTVAALWLWSWYEELQADRGAAIATGHRSIAVGLGLLQIHHGEDKPTITHPPFRLRQWSLRRHYLRTLNN